MPEVQHLILTHSPMLSYDPFAVVKDSENMHFRNKVQALVEYMKDLPQIELPLEHLFAPKLYSRTIFMPKGALVIGRIHKNSCINVVTMGSCRVWTEEGEKMLRAGDIWASVPGTQRVVMNLEDVIWTTIHQNLDDLSDLKLLEDQIILPDYSSIPILDVEPELLLLKEA